MLKKLISNHFPATNFINRRLVYNPVYLRYINTFVDNLIDYQHNDTKHKMGGFSTIKVNGEDKILLKEEITPSMSVERVCKKILFENKELHESQLIEDEGPLGTIL